MGDKDFYKIMGLALTHKKKYDYFLSVAEAEYERRFGNHPVSIGDSFWVDKLYNDITGQPPTVDEVTENALLCKELDDKG